MVGRASGRQLHALSHNRDPRRVQAGRRRRSMGAQRAMGRGPHRLADIDASLIALVDRVTGRMRRADRVGRTVVLRLRFDDFERATRSRTLTTPTADTGAAARRRARPAAEAEPLIRERGLTLVGVDDHQSRRPRAPSSSCCRSSRPQRGARHRARRGARPVRRRLADPRRAARARHRPGDADAARLTHARRLR